MIPYCWEPFLPPSLSPLATPPSLFRRCKGNAMHNLHLMSAIREWCIKLRPSNSKESFLGDESVGRRPRFKCNVLDECCYCCGTDLFMYNTSFFVILGSRPPEHLCKKNLRPNILSAECETDQTIQTGFHIKTRKCNSFDCNLDCIN